MAIVKAPLKWMHVVFVAVTARLAQVAPTPGLQLQPYCVN